VTTRARVILLVAAGTLAVAAVATMVHKSAPPRNACAEDLRRLCNDIRRGPGRVGRCLKRHQDELSAACRALLEDARAQIQARREACNEDTQRLCGGINVSARGAVRCLTSHAAELSPACRAAVQRKQ